MTIKTSIHTDSHTTFSITHVGELVINGLMNRVWSVLLNDDKLTELKSVIDLHLKDDAESWQLDTPSDMVNFKDSIEELLYLKIPFSVNYSEKVLPDQTKATIVEVLKFPKETK